LGSSESPLAYLLQNFLAVYLSIMTSTLLPAVTRRASVLLVRPKEGDDLEVHAVSWVLFICAHTVTTLLIPIGTAFWFGDSCTRGWTKLWEPCLTKDYFTVTESIPYLKSLGLYYYPQPQYGMLELSLLEQEAVCPSDPSYDFSRDTCARGLIELLGPLFMQKMCYAILFEAVVFLVTDLAQHNVRSALGRGWWRRQWDAMTEPTEPDPMRALVWLETALVFGAHVPLLLPLLALQLTLNAYLYEYNMARAPSNSGHGPRLPLLPRAVRCHAVVVLLLEILFGMFVFIDGHSKNDDGGVSGEVVLVIVSLPVVFGMFLASQVVVLGAACLRQTEQENTGRARSRSNSTEPGASVEGTKAYHEYTGVGSGGGT